MFYTILGLIVIGIFTKLLMSALGRDKGKKKPSEGGGGDKQSQASTSSSSEQQTVVQEAPTPITIPQVPVPVEQPGGGGEPQPAPGQGKGKKGKKGQQQPSRETTPAVEQPPPQVPAPVEQPATGGGGEPQPAPGQGKGKKGKKGQQQPSRETTPVVEQPPPQAPAPAVVQPTPVVVEQPTQPSQGKGKGKKGKKEEQQPSRETTPVVEQPPPQVKETQPADAPPSQPGQGKKKKGKKQQEQQPSAPMVAPTPVEPSARALPPQQRPGEPAKAAWGRGAAPAGRGQSPPQQPQQVGAPPQQPQVAPAWGSRGRAPPQGVPQPVGVAHGRGQVPSQQPPPQAAPAWGRGRTSPPQGAPQVAAAPPGRGQAPQQRGVDRRLPAGHGRGATPKESRAPTPGSVQSLEAPMQQLKIGEPKGAAAKAPPPGPALDVPRRKDLRSGGTRGQPCLVETNHLALNINPKLEIAYHFDVAIDPDRPKKMMQVVWNLFKQQYLARIPVAFDGVKNAYSPQRFHDVAGEVMAAEDETSRPKEYKVLVKYAADVNLRELFSYMQSGCRTPVPQEALQCIDIVLRDACAVRFVRVGRSFFTPPGGRIVDLGDGLELWHGHFQSAVIGWKPFLNVDVAHKGFPRPQKVTDLMFEMTRMGQGDQMRSDDAQKISKFLKSLKVQYELPGKPSTRKCYRVNSLVNPPGSAMFVPTDKPQMSVLQYFKTEKNYNIEFVNLPCLWVGPNTRKIYLPPELCTILAGQVYNRKLNEIQTSNMVRNAATNTDVRKQKIMSSVDTVRYNDNPVVRAFGLQVGREFEKVKARYLAPPALEYNKQRSVMPSRGVWRAGEFLEAASLPQGSWTIISLDRRTRDDSLNNFARLVQQNCRQLGMTIEPPQQPFIHRERFDDRDFDRILQENQKKKLIFVVVPDFPTNVYGRVKRAAEIRIGCLTQCLKSKTMYKMNPATVGNILLKVNAKLNGHNHTIVQQYRPPCLQVPCMIMGADVTHPSPDQTDIPSVAAVTASCDPRAFQYNFCWRLQDPRQEIIDDLMNIVVEQLKFFYSKTGQKPQRIIFFRDGVSEGQFREVMNMEVQAIRRACRSLQQGYEPPITFLVVQKRHHTRFFPTNSRESEDRNMNVRAGTVVDTEITHPTALEYYLVSHASIQGVARPTKYRVLWDDMWKDQKLSEDELQALTYYLCHMFSRCTRSVSYPAPTYYAHLAAFRVRAYIDDRQRINLDALAKEQEAMKIKNEILRGLPMFFV